MSGIRSFIFFNIKYEYNITLMNMSYIQGVYPNTYPNPIQQRM